MPIVSRARKITTRYAADFDARKVSKGVFDNLPHRIHYPVVYDKSDEIQDVLVETQWNDWAKADYVARFVFKLANGKRLFAILERDEVSGFLAKEG